MHLRESRTSKFSGLQQIYPPVTLKYPLVQKLIETPASLIGIKSLGPVVQKVDSAIHHVNHYPVDSAIGAWRNALA